MIGSHQKLVAVVVRSIVVGALALSAGRNALAQGWEVHTPPVIEGGIQINPPDVNQMPGFTIVMQKGQTMKLSAKVIDVDRKLKASSTEYDYKNDDGEVAWTKTGGGSLSPARTASGTSTTYTAPAAVGTFTITATPDDKPTLADDAPGSGFTINVKVVDSCPDSISGAWACNPVPDWTWWTSYGYLYSQMCVSGGTPPNPPNNWNGLLVRSNMITKSNSCNAVDFNIIPSCDQSYTWVVGSGYVGLGGEHCTTQCNRSNADNCFIDELKMTNKDSSYLVAGHGPCEYVCEAAYYCKDTYLGKATYTFNMKLESGKCKIAVTRN